MAGAISGCKAPTRSSNCARVMTVLQSAVGLAGAGFAVLPLDRVSQRPWIVITGSLGATLEVAPEADLEARGAIARLGRRAGVEGRGLGAACPSAMEPSARTARLRKYI